MGGPVLCRGDALAREGDSQGEPPGGGGFALHRIGPTDTEYLPSRSFALGAGAAPWRGRGGVPRRTRSLRGGPGCREEGRADTVTGRVLSARLLYPQSSSAAACLSQAQNPSSCGIQRKRLALLLWKEQNSYLSSLTSILRALLRQIPRLSFHSLPKAELAAATPPAEGGWPFKATFFPPRAVWLGWRR